MKHLIVSICLFFSGQSIAQDVAIDFIDNQLEAALETADREGKVIFVDAYTTWCGPCKMMDRDVFSDAAVAKFFNEHFVNLKLDMEKGEGSAFRKKYAVRGFPSFLFLNAAGAVVHRGIGYQPAEQFLALGNAALDPSQQSGGMAKSYADGNRKPEFLLKYAESLLSSGDDKGAKIGAEYLATQDSWTSKENMSMVARLMREYGDPYFKYMVEKRHLFIKEFGTERVDATLRSTIDRHLYSNPEHLSLEKAKEIYSETFPSNKAARSHSLFEIDYHLFKDDKSAYAEQARKHIKSYPDQSANSLNSMAWSFYENLDNRKDLKAAVKWAKKSIALDTNSYNTDTLAALYFKLGKKKPALRWAHKSIDLAKEAGMEFGETENLLQKINSL